MTLQVVLNRLRKYLLWLKGVALAGRYNLVSVPSFLLRKDCFEGVLTEFPQRVNAYSCEWCIITYQTEPSHGL